MLHFFAQLVKAIIGSLQEKRKHFFVSVMKYPEEEPGTVGPLLQELKGGLSKELLTHPFHPSRILNVRYEANAMRENTDYKVILFRVGFS